MFSVIRWLFGQRPARPTSTEMPQQHIGNMTHNEASHYYEDRRQDPAALDRPPGSATTARPPRRTHTPGALGRES